MMAWRPRDLYDATPFEFWCAWEGFAQFHGAGQKQNEPMTRAELDALRLKHGV